MMKKFLVIISMVMLIQGVKAQETEPQPIEPKSEVVTSIMQYPETLYSDIDLSYLQALQTVLRPYAKDKEAAAFLSKVNDAIEHKNIYDGALQVLSSPLKVDDCGIYHFKIAALKDKVSEAQYQEMEKNLDYFLTRYPSFVSDLQTLIKKFNDEVQTIRESNSSADLCQGIINEVFNAEDVTAKLNKYLPHYPYIKNLYEAYMKALKRNPMQHPATEKEILNIKTQ
jgi:hypothetical protein